MRGSTFYHAPIIAEQGVKDALFYDDDVFPTLELAVLQTPDFEALLANSGISWSLGEPLGCENNTGIAIFQINPDAIAFVLNLPAHDQCASTNMRCFREFIAKNGADSIYQDASF